MQLARNRVYHFLTIRDQIIFLSIDQSQPTLLQKDSFHLESLPWTDTHSHPSSLTLPLSSLSILSIIPGSIMAHFFPQARTCSSSTRGGPQGTHGKVHQTIHNFSRTSENHRGQIRRDLGKGSGEGRSDCRELIAIRERKGPRVEQEILGNSNRREKPSPPKTNLEKL